MTNDEIRRNDEIRMTKPATAQPRVFRHLGFGFLSSFVIQRLVQVRFTVPMHTQNRKEAFQGRIDRALVASLTSALLQQSNSIGYPPGIQRLTWPDNIFACIPGPFARY